MSSKVLVVFGATGAQGGSVIKTVLSDPELSSRFQIRAITRDPGSPNAQALVEAGCTVVKADLDDDAAVSAACAGAHTVFGVTFSFDDAPIENEYLQGKRLADAAVAAKAHWLIWSTLPLTAEISGGKYTKVQHFDVKGRVEQYVRNLPIRHAFFSPGTFMSNLATFMKPRPSWTGDGTYLLSGPQSPGTNFPLLDTAHDTGKWVGAILAEPEKFEGKTLYGATKLYTMAQQAEIFSKVTGKTVNYAQVDGKAFASHIPGDRGAEVVEMMLYFQDFGYWGEETDKLVEWSAKQARGKLTTFEEFITTVSPVSLE